MCLMSSKQRRVTSLLVALVALMVWPASGVRALEPPPDAAFIRQRMERLNAFLDSPDYAETVAWPEHIVLMYKLTQGRAPTPLEFSLLLALRQNIGLTRSAALSMALRHHAASPTWGQCREWVDRIDVADFQVDQEITDLTRQLAAVSRQNVRRQLKQLAAPHPTLPIRPQPAQAPLPDVSYNIYFGYLHAHSDLSDGQGSPLEAYTYAHEQGELDFFALTDHGELLNLWPWQHEWEELMQAAEATYQPGLYVTLWGFEWSNPLLGHLNVMNTSDFTDTLADIGLRDIYDWIVERPEAFARFNHPGYYDYDKIELWRLAPYPDAVPQMVGIETWNQAESFDVYYYDGSWSPFNRFSYWDVGNRRGWYLGALGGQDNHARDWGTLNDFRTAVLAEDLTREQIIDAYRQRRFYATEDKDLHLDVRCQGYPMGTRLAGGQREFTVSAWDGSGDTFQEVRLYRNGKLLQTRAVSGNVIQTTLSDVFRTGADYYYVIVRQDDDHDGNGRNDEALSSPIWID